MITVQIYEHGQYIRVNVFSALAITVSTDVAFRKSRVRMLPVPLG